MEALAAKILWFHSVDYCEWLLKMAAIFFHYNAIFPRQPLEQAVQGLSSSCVTEIGSNFLGVKKMWFSF